MENDGNLLDTSSRIIAGFIMFFISSIGILVHGYIIIEFRKKPQYRIGFYLLCTNRTVSSFIICFICLIWPATCTIIGFFYLPDFFNMIFGQLAGMGAYMTGCYIQMMMAANRFFVVYWPMKANKDWKFGLYASLVFCWSVGFAHFASGLTGCSYIYFIDMLSWYPVDIPCAWTLLWFLSYSSLTLTIITNLLNIIAFVKLVSELKKSSSLISVSESASRNKKKRLMFAQSFAEGLLRVTDLAFGTYLSFLSTELWYSFICNTLSWLITQVLDGIVLLIFHKDIWPKWCMKQNINNHNHNNMSVAVFATEISKLDRFPNSPRRRHSEK